MWDSDLRDEVFAMRFVLTVGVVFVAAAFGSSRVESEETSELLTPDEVWKGFDPDDRVFDEEIVRRFREDGYSAREVYFDAYVHGSKVRVYGLYAVPISATREGAARLPALMHLHGGGQTVGKHWVRNWTQRGYAFLSINSHGEWPDRKRYTEYPEKLRHGNHREAKALLKATVPNVRASSWYIWTAVNRRALAYLAQQKEVNPDRIGICGISMGGTSVWSVAMDRRVRAACAVYGIGWNEHSIFARKLAEDAAFRLSTETERQRRWNAGMAPQAYPPYLRSPMLVLNASNDQHGNLDYVFDTVGRLPKDVPWSVAITPHFRHHIGYRESKNLELWMDAWLEGKADGRLANGQPWPKTPSARLEVDNEGEVALRLELDDAESAEDLRVFYNVGNTENKSRYWREVSPGGNGATRIAKLTTIDLDLPLVAFANVYYESGVVVTCPLVHCVPRKLGATNASDRRSNDIYRASSGLRDWTTRSPGTDPNPPIARPLRILRGPDGRPGIAPDNKYRRLMTYKIGDPKWRGPEDAKLRFRVYSKTAQRVVIRGMDAVVSHRANSFVALIELTGGERWQTVTLGKSDLPGMRKKAPTLSSWSELVALEILPVKNKPFADADIAFDAFEWVEEPAR